MLKTDDSTNKRIIFCCFLIHFYTEPIRGAFCPIVVSMTDSGVNPWRANHFLENIVSTPAMGKQGNVTRKYFDHKIG